MVLSLADDFLKEGNKFLTPNETDQITRRKRSVVFLWFRYCCVVMTCPAARFRVYVNSCSFTLDENIH